MTELISSLTMTFNEEARIPALMESLKGVDEIIIVDHESTDNTVKIATELGAKVIVRPLKIDHPTQDDVINFAVKFGVKPSFTPETNILDFECNECLKYAKNDWIFWPDADEIVTWDLSEIQKILPLCDQVGYKFVHDHKLDGTPSYVLQHNKLFRKSKHEWWGIVHECIVGKGPVRKMDTDKMRVDHWRKPKPYHADYLLKLEYAVIKVGGPRNLWYLAREYADLGKYENALKFYDEYLKFGTDRGMIAEAFRRMAGCGWQLHKDNGDYSREYCLKAISVNPDFAEALKDMSEYTGEGQKPYWKRYSEVATSQNVLFVTV
jgi:glycosyltransferase involved in cell wall biosynthesis